MAADDMCLHSFDLLLKLQKLTSRAFPITNPKASWYRLGEALGSCDDRHTKSNVYKVGPDFGRLRNCIDDVLPEQRERVAHLKRLAELPPKNFSPEGFLQWWRENAQDFHVYRVRFDPLISPFRVIACAVDRDLQGLFLEPPTKSSQELRDDWIYEQYMGEAKLTVIKRNLVANEQGWDKITSISGIRARARLVHAKLGLGDLPKRRSGRPRK